MIHVAKRYFCRFPPLEEPAFLLSSEYRGEAFIMGVESAAKEARHYVNGEARIDRDILLILVLIVAGGILAYIDHQLQLHTILLEILHAIILTILFIACLVCQHRNSEITQFGWTKIVWGIGFLMMAGWADLLDEVDVVILGIPFGHSWQQAFLEKVLGYSVGIGLVSFGFFQWVPWMIQTRNSVARLNRDLSKLLMSLDDHVESERLNISRELHDDVAQRLTFLNYQTQYCRNAINTDPAEAKTKLKEIETEISETLKTVRQISRDLRPESLYALGFIAAFEQFLEKQRSQVEGINLHLECHPLENNETIWLEKVFNDRNILHLFRILQEGVRNAIKHSGATDIKVTFRETPERFEFSVEDNGKGLPWKEIPPDETLIQQGHLGIAGLKERVSELGGRFSLGNREEGHSNMYGAKMEIIIEK